MENSTEQAKNTLKKKPRIAWIDYAKLFTIYLIIIAHNTLINTKFHFFIVIYIVAFFFFLSGITVKKRAFKDDIIHTFRTIIVPYFWLYLVSYLLKNAIRYTAWLANNKLYMFSSHWQDIRQAILGLFLGNTIKDIAYFEVPPLWFLLALFWCRVLFALNNSLIEFIKLRVRLKNDSIIYALFSLLCAVLAVFMRHDLPYMMQQGFRVYLIFALGHILSKILLQIPTKKDLKMFFLHIIIAVLTGLIALKISLVTGKTDIFEGLYGTPSSPLLWYIGAISGCAMLLNISMVLRFPKFCDFYSQNTIIILVFHWTFGIPVARKIACLLWQNFDKNAVETFQVLVIAFIALIVCAVPIFIINQFFPFVINRPYSKQSLLYNLVKKQK